MNMNNKVKYLFKIYIKSTFVMSFLYILIYSIIINNATLENNWFRGIIFSNLDWLSVLSYSLNGGIVVVYLYNRWLWRWNCFMKIPVLKKEYCGYIVYNYRGIKEKKDIKLKINQTFLSIKIKLMTNEVTSLTVTSELVLENGSYVIYYTYLTNPLSEFSDKNPIQRGTCRLSVDKVESLTGTYWTNRKTTGDLYLCSVVK